MERKLKKTSIYEHDMYRFYYISSLRIGIIDTTNNERK